MIPEVETLVRGIDDNGVVTEAKGIELLHQAAHAFIHPTHAAQVVLDVALIIPMRARLAIIHTRRLGIEWAVVFLVGGKLLRAHALEIPPQALLRLGRVIFEI